MEPALVDEFVERIEQRLGETSRDSKQALRRRREHQKEMVLGAMGISVRAACAGGDLHRARRRDRRLLRARRDRGRQRALVQ
jgi:hypothetical protein